MGLRGRESEAARHAGLTSASAYRRAESVEIGVIRSTVVANLVLEIGDLWRATFA